MGFFNYVPRVLDAWVAVHRQQAWNRFERRDTVRDRRVHVPIPVQIDDTPLPELGPQHLQAAFSAAKVRLLIWGEGGAGKTSLACQLARWAMNDNSSRRLTRHLMLPVLIEDELTAGEAGKRLVEAVRGQIGDLTGTSEPVPEELLLQLLRQRRVLVIVDHLSEMSEATRTEVRPERPEFPVNALIVTSRIDEALGQVTRTNLKPRRIAGNRLSWFMDAYLTQRGKRDLFEDPEYFDACRSLSLMVGEPRNITVLLAKLYAEQMVGVKEGLAETDLPDNVPDLMLRYVNEVNRSVPENEKCHDRDVQKCARIVAWECLRQTLRPTEARRDDVLAALGGDTAQERLAYLEERLRLVQTTGEARDRVRFALDPLAEYLAGLHVLESHGSSESAWREFLAQADKMPGSPEAIAGFLLAMRDCCLAKGKDAQVPGYVAQELGKRAGLDPEMLKRVQMEQRVQHLMASLAAPEAIDRTNAAKALAHLGPHAKSAVPALIRLLTDQNIEVQLAGIDAFE
jgi:HEAT repeat protein